MGHLLIDGEGEEHESLEGDEADGDPLLFGDKGRVADLLGVHLFAHPQQLQQILLIPYRSLDSEQKLEVAEGALGHILEVEIEVDEETHAEGPLSTHQGVC